MERVIKCGAPTLEFYSFCIEAPELGCLLAEVVDEYIVEGERMLAQQSLLLPQDIFKLEQALCHLREQTPKNIVVWIETLSKKEQKNLMLLWALCRYEECNGLVIVS